MYNLCGCTLLFEPHNVDGKIKYKSINKKTSLEVDNNNIYNNKVPQLKSHAMHWLLIIHQKHNI